MKEKNKDIIKYVSPSIAVMLFLGTLGGYFNKNIDNRFLQLEHDMKNCIRQQDVDRRIDEKLVPVVQEFKFTVQQLQYELKTLNEKLGLITEIKVRHHRD